MTERNRRLTNTSSMSLFFYCELDSINRIKYLAWFILASEFTWSHHVAECVISKVNQRLGLLCRIKRLLLLAYNRLDYVDLVWVRGKKAKLLLWMTRRVCRAKSRKLFLTAGPLYSSATDALISSKRLNLDRRCTVYISLCITPWGTNKQGCS